MKIKDVMVRLKKETTEEYNFKRGEKNKTKIKMFIYCKNTIRIAIFF